MDAVRVDPSHVRTDQALRYQVRFLISGLEPLEDFHRDFLQLR
jgi:hypothetical protein